MTGRPIDGRQGGASSLGDGRATFRSLQSQVLHRLGLLVVGGEFGPGTTLPNDVELLERFGVSRTVLREAMKALAAKNMVVARARIGTKVLPRRQWSMFDPDVLAWHFEVGPDDEFLRSLSEIRLSIELDSAALACERRTDAQVETMLQYVDAMAKAVRMEDFARADLGFHRVVAEASANPFMLSISALVDVALTSAFLISSPVDRPDMQAESVERHLRIAAAIRDRDAEEARAAMRVVICEGYDRSIGRLSKSEAAV